MSGRWQDVRGEEEVGSSKPYARSPSTKETAFKLARVPMMAGKVKWARPTKVSSCLGCNVLVILPILDEEAARPQGQTSTRTSTTHEKLPVTTA